MSDQPLSTDPVQGLLGPPRFSLRTLLIAMAALGCLFALLTAVGRMEALVILLFLGLAIAHVLGNTLGTRLVDRSSQQPANGDDSTRASRDLARRASAIPSRLSRRIALRRITSVMAFGGAALGAFVGGTGLAATYPEAGAAAVAMGVASSAVLGGFAGFLASSFLSVLHDAWREALANGESRPASRDQASAAARRGRLPGSPRGA